MIVKFVVTMNSFLWMHVIMVIYANVKFVALINVMITYCIVVKSLGGGALNSRLYSELDHF